MSMHHAPVANFSVIAFVRCCMHLVACLLAVLAIHLIPAKSRLMQNCSALHCLQLWCCDASVLAWQSLCQNTLNPFQQKSVKCLIGCKNASQNILIHFPVFCEFCVPGTRDLRKRHCDLTGLFQCEFRSTGATHRNKNCAVNLYAKCRCQCDCVPSECSSSHPSEPATPLAPKQSVALERTLF